MRNDGSILEQIIKDQSLTLQVLADNLNVTRQTVMNYFVTKRFSKKVMYRLCEYFNITEYEFLNYSVAGSNIGSIISDNNTKYKSKSDDLFSCLDQLKTTNKMLEKALDNEARALSLLDHFIKKSN